MSHKPRRRPRPITLDEVMDLGPCGRYTRGRIRARMGGESITVAALERTLLEGWICDEDARWLLTRLLPHRERVLWAADCVSRVLERLPVGPRAFADVTIAAARAWAEDPTELHRRRALDAAASWSYVGDPNGASWAAASAASSVSHAAAYDYARDASSAAFEAAGFALCEHQWQIRRACHYLRKVRMIDTVPV